MDRVPVVDSTKNVVKQCATCPWRVDCDPMTDIPNYVPALHHRLDKTIAEPGSITGLACSKVHIMACHYSKPGAEFPCAGWLHHQIGSGNNIAIRLRMMTGQMPVPIVDGEQHETFEDTLCNVPNPEGTQPIVRRPEYKRTHLPKTAELATRSSMIVCCECRKPDDNMMLLRAQAGYADSSRPCCSACFLREDGIGRYLRGRFTQYEMPSPIPERIVQDWTMVEVVVPGAVAGGVR